MAAILPIPVHTMLRRALSLFQAGHLVESLDIVRQAVELAPDDPQVQHVARELARLTMETRGTHTPTLDRRDRAHRLNDRGATLMNRGDLTGAIDCFEQAIGFNANLPLAHANLAEAKRTAGTADGAIEHLETAVKLAPENHAYRCQLGHALRDSGRIEAAMACFETVRANAPGNCEAMVGIATCLEKTGHAEIALGLLGPLVEKSTISHNLAVVFARLCRQQGQPADGVPVLRRLIDRDASTQEQVLLLHTLAECLDAMGESSAAFRAATQANGLRTGNYQPAAYAAEVNQTIEAFTLHDLCSGPGAQVDTHRQVLVVGFPRSGTSLVEQILASHPRGYGAGEREELSLLSLALSRHGGPNGHWTAGLKTCTTADLDEMARFYTARVNAGAGNALRVVDKMPGNTAYLGLAASVLPQARIIHCMRSPIDTCLSAYFKNFRSAYAFSTRLNWLGQHYLATERLMTHWKQVLPNRILEVQYETLVDDPEAQIRRIVDFAGLPWDGAVLNFHRNKRLNNTASHAQVRKPIYRSSVGRADAYSAWLEPLIEVLYSTGPSAA